MFIKNNSSVPSEILILDDRIILLVKLYEKVNINYLAKQI